MVEQPRVVDKSVRTEGVKQPMTWENLSRLKRLNYVSLNVYTLHKEEKRHHLSLSRNGNDKFSTVIPTLFLAEKHMALINDVETYHRKLTRTPPSKSIDIKFCKIFFSSVPTTVYLSPHECQYVLCRHFSFLMKMKR